MTRNEFLSELENSLEGKLPQDEVREILNDYNDIFENSIYDGKTEESAALELGSPAKIARKILEDEPKYTEVKNTVVDTRSLASIAKRFGAFAIDTVIGAVIILALLATAYLPFRNKEMVTWTEATGGNGYEARLYKDSNGATTKVDVLDRTGKYLFKGNIEEFPKFLDANGIKYPDDFQQRSHVITYKSTIPTKVGLLIVLVSLGIGNLFNSVITWKLKGYTIGKKLFKIKVEKIDGSEISFMDALFRELIIKSLANVILGGLLNLGSLIWAALTSERNTVHDRASKTIVVSVRG